MTGDQQAQPAHFASQEADDAEAFIALQNLEKRRAAKRRSRRLKIVGAIAAVAVAGGGLLLRNLLTPAPAEVDYGPDVAVVERRDFTTSVQGTGSLSPYESVVVTPEVNGIIDTVKVSEGQSVGVGDVLLTIRSDEIDKAIAAAASTLGTAQESLGEANASYAEMQAAIDSDRAAYQAAAAQHDADSKKAQEAYDKAYAQHDEAIARAKDVMDAAVRDEQVKASAVEDARVVWEPLNNTFEAAKAAYDTALAKFNEDVATRLYLKGKQTSGEELTPVEAAKLTELDTMGNGLSVYDQYEGLFGEILIDPDNPVVIENPGKPCLKKAMDDAAQACVTPRETYDAAIFQHDQAARAAEEATEAYNQALAAADSAAQAAAAVVPVAPLPDFSEATAQAQLDAARGAVTAAASAVDAASKSYDDAVAAGEKRTVKSPTVGTVVSVGAVAGQAVGSGASGTGSLVQIADISKMRVSIDVNEIDISQVKVGQHTRCTFSALPDLELEGTVVSVASTSTGSGMSEMGYGGGGVVTFKVEVVIDKPDQRVKPGMTASVTILTQEVADALVVPSMAVTEDGTGSYVYVVTDPETFEAERRDVTVGAKSISEAVIESGLSEGDLVLLTAPMEGEMAMPAAEAAEVEG